MKAEKTVAKTVGQWAAGKGDPMAVEKAESKAEWTADLRVDLSAAQTGASLAVDLVDSRAVQMV